MSADEETRAIVQRQLFLRTMTVSRPLAGSTTALARMMRDVLFQEGATLYEEGDAAEHVYFIVSGSVELRTPGAPPNRFDERSIVGGLDMLQDRPHARTAVAVTDVHALVIRSEDWLEIIEDNFEFARSALVAISTNAMRFGKELGDRGGFAPPTEGDDAPIPERPLNVVERMLALRDLPMLAKIRIQVLTSLAEVCRELRLQP